MVTSVIVDVGISATNDLGRFEATASYLRDAEGVDTAA
jgi:hypothetical protein